jgi:hypothetical protein
MLTSFFSKSKPIHFILVMIFMTMTFFWNLSAKWVISFEMADLPFYLLLLLALLFSMFLIDFVSSKNDLTKNNTFRIAFFALFIAVFPETFLNAEILFANLFLLLAVRRIISLRTKKDISKKIFDSSLWIAVAALISFWSVLFFVLLYAAIILYTNRIRDYLIPLTGAACVLLLWNVYTLITTELFYLPHFSSQDFSFDFSEYFSNGKLIQIVLVGTLFLAAFLYSQVFSKRRKKFRSRNLLLYFLTVLSLGIIILIPKKDTAEFLFFALPFCVIVSNFMELSKLKTLKEAVFWALLFLPFLSMLV